MASTSTLYGGESLDYLLDVLTVLYKDTKHVLFLPYARPGGISHEQYTERIKLPFKKIGKTIQGIQDFGTAEEAIKQAKGIYVGGGNTFVLVNELYKNKCINGMKNAVKSGIPYLGTSAGSNICGLSMCTSNDMPIVYPPSFKTLGLVPFNINPHYLDPIKGSTHMGETTEMRINEFHEFNTQPVVGLREGSYIEVLNESVTLKGHLNARIFSYGIDPYEVETNTNLNLLK